MSKKISCNGPKYRERCLNKVGTSDVVRIECYVQEYRRSDRDKLCARLRDKKTNKKVCICTDDPMMHGRLLAFLSQAKSKQAIMPTIFDRDGTDVVAVRGVIVNETDEDIDVDIQVLTGGFLFEDAMTTKV